MYMYMIPEIIHYYTNSLIRDQLFRRTINIQSLFCGDFHLRDKYIWGHKWEIFKQAYDYGQRAETS